MNLYRLFTPKKTTMGAYFYNKTYNIAYKRIPKSACTTIEKWLAEHHNNHTKTPDLKIHSEEANSLYFDKVETNKSALPNCYTFTFVRNPYDRFLSFYKNKILTDKPEKHIFKNLKDYGIYPNMPIEECALRLSEVKNMAKLNPHVIPQSLFIFSGRVSEIDFIGRLENFHSDSRHLQQKINSKIPFRISNTSKDNQLTLSTRSKTLIAKAYKKDFILLGYKI
ncbi:sulfotransferase family 2 domain-containing protein [Microbulbifer sp. ANSA003]|uniref:sulfotransferase family 2 domain-containing protein n=1 Tax=Microbulbifer sp. ANSA003 TaxID=3243360 RepID=UPI004042E4B2